MLKIDEARAESLLMDERSGDAVIRCERASSELRFGRPIRIEQDGRMFAALALDAVAPKAYDGFARSAGDRHNLYLTPPRAAVLGLNASGGALVPLADASFSRACELAYQRDAKPPREWAPGLPAAAEAAEIAKLGLLLPAVVLAEIEPPGAGFRDCVRVFVGDGARSRSVAARNFEVVSRAPVPLQDVGQAEFIIFRGGLAQRDQVAIVIGEPDANAPVPVRVHSSCITGDLFGSLKCDCGTQLRLGLKSLKERGGGVLLYLDHEGRGTGIAAKMRAYDYQHQGLDTVDADAELGFGLDERRYEAAVAMLEALGYRRVDLLTNNPAKIAFLRANGIDVVHRTPALGTVTPENEAYLRTKVERAGHSIDWVSSRTDRISPRLDPVSKRLD